MWWRWGARGGVTAWAKVKGQSIGRDPEVGKVSSDVSEM